MFAQYILTSLAFFTPTVHLSTGTKVSLFGKGPPLVFSSGLFGSMPHNIYSNFVSLMEKNTTVCVVDKAIITKSDVEEVADALGVTTIGFVSHSSFDTNILNSDRVFKAVLFDPSYLPKIENFQLSQPSVKARFPVTVVSAKKTFENPKFIPDMFSLEVEDSATETFDNVGHVDLLDDTWADLGMRTGLFAGAKPNPVSFLEWNNRNVENIKDARKRFRLDAADIVKKFMNAGNENDDKSDDDKKDNGVVDIVPAE